MTRRSRASLLAAFVAVAGTLALVPAGATACDPVPVDPMPEASETHDHANAAHHDFQCGLEVVAARDLLTELPQPTMFGEVDIAGNLAVLAIAYPEAGFVLFDIEDPTDPTVLSVWHGPNCEQFVQDTDCGADVKLRPDGTEAFVFTQNITRIPGVPQNPQSLAGPPEPGIIAVDISNPALPLVDSYLPIEGFGVHMGAYHEIGGTEYIFVVDNLLGVSVARADRVGPKTILSPVAPGAISGEAHDVTPYDDTVDGKPYLVVSQGRQSSIGIYDVSDPSAPVQVSTWQAPGPGSWYVHSAWPFWWGDKRYTFVVPELFAGFGNTHKKVGPVWLVDITSFASPQLVATWTNPGGHKGRNLGFSPHNIWFRDGLLYLSHYHAGVWLLDWHPVLDDGAASPVILGYNVPNELVRPLPTSTARTKIITSYDSAKERPSVWDVVSDGDYAYASDMNGGLYVLEPGS